MWGIGYSQEFVAEGVELVMRLSEQRYCCARDGEDMVEFGGFGIDRKEDGEELLTLI